MAAIVSVSFPLTLPWDDLFLWLLKYQSCCGIHRTLYHFLRGRERRDRSKGPFIQERHRRVGVFSYFESSCLLWRETVLDGGTSETSKTIKPCRCSTSLSSRLRLSFFSFINKTVCRVAAATVANHINGWNSPGWWQPRLPFPHVFLLSMA